MAVWLLATAIVNRPEKGRLKAKGTIMKRLMYSGTGLLVLLLALCCLRICVQCYSLPRRAGVDLYRGKPLHQFPECTRQIPRRAGDEPITLYFFFLTVPAKGHGHSAAKLCAACGRACLKESERVAGGQIKLKNHRSAALLEAEDRAAENSACRYPLPQSGEKLVFPAWPGHQKCPLPSARWIPFSRWSRKGPA